METDKQLCQIPLFSTIKIHLLWTYECDNNSFFVLGISKSDKESTPLTDTSDDQQQIYNLYQVEISAGDNPKANFQLISQFNEPILSKNHLAASPDLSVLCFGKKISLSGKFKGHTCFTLKKSYETIDFNLIVFNGVRLVGDTLYASMSVGRVFIW